MQVIPVKFNYKNGNSRITSYITRHRRVPTVESTVLTVLICTMIFANETCFQELKAILNLVTELNQQKTLT